MWIIVLFGDNQQNNKLFKIVGYLWTYRELSGC